MIQLWKNRHFRRYSFLTIATFSFFAPQTFAENSESQILPMPRQLRNLACERVFKDTPQGCDLKTECQKMQYEWRFWTCAADSGLCRQACKEQFKKDKEKDATGAEIAEFQCRQACTSRLDAYLIRAREKFPLPNWTQQESIDQIRACGEDGRVCFQVAGAFRKVTDQYAGLIWIDFCKSIGVDVSISPEERDSIRVQCGPPQSTPTVRR